MKRPAATALLAAACTASCFLATAQAQVRRPNQENREEGIYSRTIIHPDETRTVSKQDLNNKIREKRTLDKNGILLMRSIFQLNAGGQPINGLVYDGRNRLLYRSEFVYDNASRLQEERVFGADGTPLRRLAYKQDSSGEMKAFALSFADGGSFAETGSSTAVSGDEDLERFSTNSPHAYRDGAGVANTPSAYRRTPAPSNSSTTSTSTSTSKSSKRERRFRIFRRD